jgi:tetratricopeptide (TPR) repeat protein
VNETRFAELRAEARDADLAGDPEWAIAIWDTAIDECESADRADLRDLAVCLRCAPLLKLDRLAGEVTELKRILLRAGSSDARSIAAYYIAVAYDLDDDLTRALEFARRANELAAKVDDPAHRAAAANLAGNLALLRGELEEAECAYGSALEAYGGVPGYGQLMSAQVLDNLGYVMLCTGRVDEGVDTIERATQTLESAQARDYIHQALQDLCYGYILQDHLDAAKRVGARGLELARTYDEPLVVKNLLFLLGEASVRSGDRFQARRYLSELARYYPDLANSDEMVEVLLGMDLTAVVNLRG